MINENLNNNKENSNLEENADIKKYFFIYIINYFIYNKYKI